MGNMVDSARISDIREEMKGIALTSDELYVVVPDETMAIVNDVFMAGKIMWWCSKCGRFTVSQRPCDDPPIKCGECKTPANEQNVKVWKQLVSQLGGDRA